MRKLTDKQWLKIKELLEKPNRNITAIAKKYKIARRSIYAYAWRRGWIEIKTKKTFWQRLKQKFK